ncbi:YceI family protein [Flavobacterium franklandianum]|uniref:YceI family protein n=1 Tax=Flavobacterium franklandianum TaxID=2594430 RepID=UPI00117AD9E7|nr:YceI family protein [Flavobacterium franklandianum]TRX23362.1 YceI family protein [Flavobacterium franklandianum]
MIKILTTLVFLILSTILFSQKLMTRSGEIKFEASMPAFEEVAAKNNTVSCLFDTSSGEIAVLALVKGFRFKVPLMEEHFNENYIESDQFPKASFKGKITNFDVSKAASAKSTFDVEGDLTLHGVTKKVKTKITFVKSGEKLITTCKFKVKPLDYNIEIPSVVKSKIAETVEIDLKFDLEKKL